MASESWTQRSAIAFERVSETGDDDEALVARARESAAAFSPLYHRYVRPIYGYCYHRLGSRELAEDATSQTFEKALAALPRYRSKSFRGWLYTIANNVITDLQRRRNPVPLAPEWDLADERGSPERDALAAESELSVRQLLAQLTPDQRAVVELQLEGLTGQEIASVLGRRPGTVRATKFRAFNRLRALLSKEGDEQ
jgi:RNA polymerase sigma-70 factor (ECF subfamily)